MKYNEKYDLFVDDDLVIYRWDKKLDKLVQVKQAKSKKGYMCVCTKLGVRFVHRVIWETFRYEIPEGYVIDHINTIRDDNRVENLRCVTQKENNNNPLTIKHNSEAQNRRAKSYFGEKFKKHYGIARYEDIKLYNKEQMWYTRHNNTCRWEE